MNIKKIYFGLVSLISIISLAISLGIVISNLLKIWLISDDEYISTHSYQLETCKYNIQKKYCSNSYWKDYNKCILELDKNLNYKKDLENCKENKKKEILLQRYYNLKIDLISASSSFVVFLILFIFHYLRFRKFD